MDSYVRGKLSEWQLDNLIDNFKEQEVDEESFLLLDDNAVASLIPKIGQRVKFQKHHKELFASPINPPIESNSSVESMEMTPAPTDPVTMTVELFPAFAVRQILEGTTEGKSVLSSLDSVQAITTKQRRLLVRLLVSHLLETNGETSSSETKKTLAMALVYEFPCLKDNTGSSYGAWYTPGRKHRPATGFLEERLRNIRKRIRKLNPSSRLEPQQDQSATTTENAVPPEKFQEMVGWLKMHKYPISEVESYMKETAVYRGRWIRNNVSKTISEIVKEFPRLVDNPGMIPQDFKQLHPAAEKKLFENWASLSERLLVYAQREGKLQFVPGDMTPAAKGETALKILPTLLPPSIYKRGGKVYRPTTVEAQRSFIDLQPVGTNMVEYLQQSEMTGTVLHVLCLGDETRGTCQTFAIIGGNAIETDSLLEAVDVCFKGFFCL